MDNKRFTHRANTLGYVTCNIGSFFTFLFALLCRERLDQANILPVPGSRTMCKAHHFSDVNGAMRLLITDL